VVAQHEPAHPGSGHVELDRRSGRQAAGDRLLGDVATPVVAKLEAGAVQAAVFHGIAAAQVPVAIVQDGQRAQDVDACADREPRRERELDVERVEHTGGAHVVDQLGQRVTGAHRQREDARAVGIVGVDRAAHEGAPSEALAALLGELRAEDAGRHHHGTNTTTGPS
jgi:hypothetical protein